MDSFGKDITQILVLIIGIAALSIVVGNAGGFSTDVGSVGQVFDSSLATASSAGADVSGGGPSSSYQPMSMSTLTGSGFSGIG